MEIESKYLDENSAEKDTIYEILDEGTKEIKPTSRTNSKGQVETYVVYNFIVYNGRYNQIYTPNSEAQDLLVKHFGRETKNWKNKKLQFDIVDRKYFGVERKVIIPKFIEVKA